MSKTETTDTGVLAGVRIIEVAGIGPGPFCGMLLADLGAEVISIERPQPGPARPRPTAIVQRGKRSVTLDPEVARGAGGGAALARRRRRADRGHAPGRHGAPGPGARGVPGPAAGPSCTDA